jgi:hypothetical protein
LKGTVANYELNQAEPVFWRHSCQLGAQSGTPA